MSIGSGLSRPPFHRSTSENPQCTSAMPNDWLSNPYSENTNSQSFLSSNNATRGTQWNPPRNYTSYAFQRGSPTSSESSWSSSDMTGMSRWPSEASIASSTSSISSFQSTRSMGTASSTRSTSFPSTSNTSLNSSISNTSSSTKSSNHYSPRNIYASHSVFLDNLRSSGDSDDSFNSEFERFFNHRKWNIKMIIAIDKLTNSR